MDNTKTITHLEWCAGYGGIHIGLKRVIKKLRLIALCEIEAYACANLVAKMEEGLMDPVPIWTDLKTFPSHNFHGLVDIFTAGYPCQPFSHAGRRKGEDDPRHLWPFIQRAVGIIRPRLCFFENVEGHITLGLKDVLHDLEGLGYIVTAGLFSAAECGATHQRKRIFILALADEHREWGSQQSWGIEKQRVRTIDSGENMAETSSARGAFGVSGSHERHEGDSSFVINHRNRLPAYPPGPEDIEGWRKVLEIDPTLEPAFRRVAHGYPDAINPSRNRADRLRLCGNGVVPDTVKKAFKTLFKEIITK